MILRDSKIRHINYHDFHIFYFIKIIKNSSEFMFILHRCLPRECRG